jgi:hypothetical protein
MLSKGIWSSINNLIESEEPGAGIESAYQRFGQVEMHIDQQSEHER